MKTDLIGTELNAYRKQALIEVLDGVEVDYKETFMASRLTWFVVGSFIWNIDKAMGRVRVNLNNDQVCIASEFVDDFDLYSTEELSDLYYSIDKALVERLFALRRITRKLESLQ